MRKALKTFNNIKINPIGIGCQRINANNPKSKLALEKALKEARCNFIDTASSYTNGASETLIGQVL